MEKDENITIPRKDWLDLVERVKCIESRLSELREIKPLIEGPTLKELAIQAACGGVKDHDRIFKGLENEAARTGRSVIDILKETTYSIKKNS
jgi:hypothetical protein